MSKLSTNLLNEDATANRGFIVTGYSDGREGWVWVSQASSKEEALRELEQVTGAKVMTMPHHEYEGEMVLALVNKANPGLSKHSGFELAIGAIGENGFAPGAAQW